MEPSEFYYDPSELDNIKFKSVSYSFDSGLYVKFGITEDGQMYVLDIGEIHDEILAKALDGRVLTEER